MLAHVVGKQDRNLFSDKWAVYPIELFDHPEDQWFKTTANSIWQRPTMHSIHRTDVIPGGSIPSISDEKKTKITWHLIISLPKQRTNAILTEDCLDRKPNHNPTHASQYPACSHIPTLALLSIPASNQQPFFEFFKLVPLVLVVWLLHSTEDNPLAITSKFCSMVSVCRAIKMFGGQNHILTRWLTSPAQQTGFSHNFRFRW